MERRRKEYESEVHKAFTVELGKDTIDNGDLQVIGYEAASPIKKKNPALVGTFRESLPGENLDLPEVQEQLHRKTDRNRILKEYGHALRMKRLVSTEEEPLGLEERITEFLEERLQQNGSVMWVDLACGNGAALRQARLGLTKKGYDMSKVRTVGIDILPIDTNDLQRYINDFPKLYEANLGSDEFAPEFIQGDCTQMQFPEEADLITGVEVLQWVKDPLAIIGNAITQLKIGGMVGFNRAHNLFYTDNQDASSDPREILVESESNLFYHLFTQKTGFYENLDGFDTLEGNGRNDSTVLLRKNSVGHDFSKDYRLVSRGKWLQGYQYLYTNQNGVPA